MYNLGIDGVDFVLCNTDSKALEQSLIPVKVQLGPLSTSGLGAGANPEVGAKATEESIAEVTKILEDGTKMAFVTAGMGGGTGTGGAPVISKISKEMGILTVGIVTTPFSYEGPKRRKQAEEGIAKMKEHVDTVLVISNDKVRNQFGNLGFKNAFSKADDILATATKCITDIINSKGHVIVDFADVCTVMRNGGVAILGSAISAGENRALEAVEKAINSPLLNDNNISGAKWILLNINSAEGEYEHTLDEMDTIQTYVHAAAGAECDVILGMGYDNNLGDAISVTIIATGFEQNELKGSYNAGKPKPEEIKVIHQLGANATTAITPEAEAVTSEPTATSQSVATESIVNEDAPIVYQLAPAAEVPRCEDATPVPAVQPPVAIEPMAAPIQMQSPEPILKAHLMPRPFVPEAPAVPQIAAMRAKPMPAPVVDMSTEQKVVLNLSTTSPEPIIETQVSTPEPSNNYTQPADDFITIDGITINRRMGSRMLTDDEVIDKIAFEQKKKSFEERAQRLRGVSFQVQHGTNPNDVENVPAYLRKQVELEQHPNSAADNTYSTLKIDEHGNVDTRNSFLHGDKPC
jgi:cell division protein FtsZ